MICNITRKYTYKLTRVYGYTRRTYVNTMMVHRYDNEVCSRKACESYPLESKSPLCIGTYMIKYIINKATNVHVGRNALFFLIFLSVFNNKTSAGLASPWLCAPARIIRTRRVSIHRVITTRYSWSPSSAVTYLEGYGVWLVGTRSPSAT
jgi:hypothetical protein